MANAKQCDRCLTFYEPYRIAVRNGKCANGFKFSDGLHYFDDNDLCPVCMAELIEWFERGEKNGN